MLSHSKSLLSIDCCFPRVFLPRDMAYATPMLETLCFGLPNSLGHWLLRTDFQGHPDSAYVVLNELVQACLFHWAYWLTQGWEEAYSSIPDLEKKGSGQRSQRRGKPTGWARMLKVKLSITHTRTQEYVYCNCALNTSQTADLLFLFV